MGEPQPVTEPHPKANTMAKAWGTVELRRMPLDALVPAAYNPRKDLRPGDPAYDALKRSIEAFGFVEPLVWNQRTNRLIGGHQRLKVLREQGAREVDVSVVDLAPAQEQALNVALNKIQGEWDLPKLGEVLRQLRASDIDETLSGFSADDIDKLLRQLTPPPPELANPDGVGPDVQVGQLWRLGPHRLFCGDATAASDVARLLDGAVPTLMVTDPPYGVEYDAGWRNEAAAKGALWYAARRVAPVTADNRVDWYAVRHGHDAGWIGDHTETTVREIALDPNVDGGHSAQKPVECMLFPLRNHRGDVYDPFVGTGTTLIAAQMMGRTCYAMDIEPRWCAVAIARWESYTGQQAELAAAP